MRAVGSLFFAIGLLGCTAQGFIWIWAAVYERADQTWIAWTMPGMAVAFFLLWLGIKLDERAL